jgi:hypothetical protein
VSRFHADEQRKQKQRSEKKTTKTKLSDWIAAGDGDAMRNKKKRSAPLDKRWSG